MKSSQNEMSGLEIAVIGMAGRFPGATDLDAYWELLANGNEGISFFSNGESTELSPKKQSDKAGTFVKAKGKIHNRESFDYEFFGYSRAEALAMDPQTRLFHEYAWAALEDAGVDPWSFRGSIGLFAGSNSSFEWRKSVESNSDEDVLGKYSQSLLGESDLMTTRVANKLNLRGPALTLFSACSTSLVSVHMAVRSLLMGESQIALAGGVAVNLLIDEGYHYQPGMILSPDGHCRSFAAAAEGTVFGDGIGVVALKRLDQALADKDPIHAVIKGSAINNDGNRKVGYTAPSYQGQSDVIAMALKLAKVQPDTIDYIEAHGTATHMGDPIEMKALMNVFQKGAHKAAVGSVKSNVGHLDSAAGVAGMIKTILALKRKQLPPSINFQNPNPEINFEDSNFFVNTELREWSRSDHPRRAGVSSFGIGGTNAHIILEEAPEIRHENSKEEKRLLVFSARTKSALSGYLKAFQKKLSLNSTINLADVEYTLSKKHSFPIRYAVVANNAKMAVEELGSSVQLGLADSRLENPSLIFMFPGQGAQYSTMGKDLYEQNTFFRKEMDTGFQLLSKYSSVNYKGILLKEGNVLKDGETGDVQPILFLFEYALGKLMIHNGFAPAAMIGHSIGEYVAACLSGAISLEDALHLVYNRGRLMQSMPEGDMLSVSTSVEELKPFLNDAISIAAVNSKANCVLSGSKEEISRAKNKLDEHGIENQILRTSHAFHSAMMDPVLPEFEDYVNKVRFLPPRIPFVSSLTGSFVCYDEISSPSYWSKQLRNTVRFAEGLSTLIKSDPSIFVEVGPGQTLTNLLQVNDLEGKHKSINLVRHRLYERDDFEYFLRGLGKIWTLGYQPDWEKYFLDQDPRFVSVPTYSFDEIDLELPKRRRLVSGAENSLSQSQNFDKWFYSMEWVRKSLNRQTGQLTTQPLEWLIFVDGSDHVGALIEGIKKRGGKVITVGKGKSYKKLSERAYEIEPAKPNDYLKLFSELKGAEAEHTKIDRILYLWGSEPSAKEPEVENVDTIMEECFGYMLHMIQAANTSGLLTEKLFLSAITVGSFDVLGQENANPYGTIITGLLKSINREFQHITAKQIDLDPISANSGTLDVTKLLDEAESAGQEEVLALRGKYVWVQHPVKVQVSQKEDVKFNDEGAYLITGGLGGLGLAFAKYIAQNSSCKLVLLGRKSVPKRGEWEDWLQQHPNDNYLSLKIRELMAIEGNGNSLMVESADVSNPVEMAAVIKRVKKEFGPITGVIHAAGVADGSLIGIRTWEETKKVLMPKIKGVVVLNEVLRNENLDFFVMFSSLSAILGEIGQSAYVAGNHFMDNFARFRESVTGSATVSINWDRWKDVGMSVTTRKGASLKVEGGLNTQDGVKAFLSAMDTGLSQVAISMSDLNQRLQMEKDNPIWSHLEDQEGGYLPEKAEDGLKGDLPDDILELFGKILGVRPQSTDDNFFECGGNSLNAIRLLALVEKKFGENIPLEVFIAKPTAGNIIEILERSGEKNDYVAIPALPVAERYLASSTQKRLYVLYQGAPDVTYYNMPQILEWENLDSTRLQEAFSKLVQRHEILRTSFFMEAGELYQRVHGQVKVEIQELLIDENKESFTEAVSNFIRPFDLNRAPLIRAAFLRSASGESYLLFDMHHIVSDAISLNLILQDFTELYDNRNRPISSTQFKDYVGWMNSSKQREVIEKQKTVWLEKFKDHVPILELPYDKPRDLSKSFAGDVLESRMNAKVTAKLREMAKRQDTDMFTILIGLYNLMLVKVSGQESVVIGTSVAGRNHADIQQTVGLFANTLALRLSVNNNNSFEEYLAGVKKDCAQAFENQAYPYEELLEGLDFKWTPGKNPLFDVMFDLKKRAVSCNTNSGAIQVLNPHDLGVKQFVSKFDLTLTATDEMSEIALSWEYSTSLFNKDTIERFDRAFKQIALQILERTEISLPELIQPDVKEKEYLLTELNQTIKDYPEEKAIHTLFEEQVKQTPDCLAVSFGDNYLTYKELNCKANQLASYLRSEHALKAGQKVGILANRSENTLIAVLAILKSGAVYVPVDPTYPQSRVAYILENAEVQVLLTESGFLFDLDFFDGALFALDIQLPKLDGDVGNLNLDTDVMQTAYILYTSGTTGEPKGVMVHHQGLVNYVCWAVEKYAEEQSCFPFFTSLSFDLTITSIFTPLLSGGNVRVYEGSPDKVLNDILTEQKVNVIKLTPTHLSLLLSIVENRQLNLQGIKTFILGGEILKAELANRLLELSGEQVEVFNEYGPTETVVGCTLYRYKTSQKLEAVVPVGKPGANVRIYLLDSQQNPVPFGTKGEIFIAGDGVALGYIKKEEQTRASFLSDSFVPGSRMYKSGDIGKWNSQKELVVLGRIDDQVKIRGYRIEPKEIENTLLSIGLSDVAVTVRGQSSDAQLIAYYVSEEDKNITSILQTLAERLPPYMIPNHLIRIDSMPLTSNNKPDLKALATIEVLGSGNSGSKGGMTKMEKKIAGFFEEVLGVQNLTAEDNFFALGGQSLKAVTLSAKIHDVLGLNVDVRDIFDRPAVGELASFIGTLSLNDEVIAIPVTEAKPYYKISSAQRKMLLMQEKFPASTMYNAPRIVEFRSMDMDRMESAFRQLIKRHEILRTTFHIGDQLLQKVHEEVDFKVERHKASCPEEVQKILNNFVKPFDLSKAPLLRIRFVSYEDSVFLLLDTHHVASDAISTQIVIRDTLMFYHDVDLPEMKLQYKDFAEWQYEQLLKSKSMEEQKTYWLNELRAPLPVIHMPYDYKSSSGGDFSGERIPFYIDPKLSEKMESYALSHTYTEFMILIGAFGLLLHLLTDEEDITIGYPVTGREYQGLENIVGPFFNTLVLRSFPVKEKPIKSYLDEVKKSMLDGMRNQDYPFEEMIGDLGLRKGNNADIQGYSVMLSYKDDERLFENLGDYGLSAQESSFARPPIQAKVPIAFLANRLDDQIKIEIEYRTSLFKESTIKRLMDYYLQIIQVILKDDSLLIKDVSLSHKLEDTKNDQPQVDFNF